MFVLGLVIGGAAVGATWYFWPKAKAEVAKVEDKAKAVIADVKF